MTAQQLIKILEIFPDAKIKVWGDEGIKAEIQSIDDEIIIDIKKSDRLI